MEVGNFGVGMLVKNTSVGVSCLFSQAGSGIVEYLCINIYEIKKAEITLNGRYVNCDFSQAKGARGLVGLTKA